MVSLDMHISYTTYQMSSEGRPHEIRQGCVERRRKNWVLLTEFCLGNMKSLPFQNLMSGCEHKRVAETPSGPGRGNQILGFKGWKFSGLHAQILDSQGLCCTVFVLTKAPVDMARFVRNSDVAFHRHSCLTAFSHWNRSAVGDTPNIYAINKH
jgi:hypothetical protein